MCMVDKVPLTYPKKIEEVKTKGQFISLPSSIVLQFNKELYRLARRHLGLIDICGSRSSELRDRKV